MMALKKRLAMLEAENRLLKEFELKKKIAMLEVENAFLKEQQLVTDSAYANSITYNHGEQQFYDSHSISQSQACYENGGDAPVEDPIPWETTSDISNRLGEIPRFQFYPRETEKGVQVEKEKKVQFEDANEINEDQYYGSKYAAPNASQPGMTQLGQLTDHTQVEGNILIV